MDVHPYFREVLINALFIPWGVQSNNEKIYRYGISCTFIINLSLPRQIIV